MKTSITRVAVGPRMSQIAIHSGTVYVGGQVPLNNPDGNISSQTVSVLSDVERLLIQAGSHKANILQCQIYLRNIGDISAFNAEWDKWMPIGHAPTRIAVQASLVDPRWLVEVSAIAALT